VSVVRQTDAMPAKCLDIVSLWPSKVTAHNGEALVNNLPVRTSLDVTWLPALPVIPWISWFYWYSEYVILVSNGRINGKENDDTVPRRAFLFSSSCLDSVTSRTSSVLEHVGLYVVAVRVVRAFFTVVANCYFSGILVILFLNHSLPWKLARF